MPLVALVYSCVVRLIWPLFAVSLVNSYTAPLTRSLATYDQTRCSRRKLHSLVTMSIANVKWSPRVQNIKDISLQKDILRDITASEFALHVEPNQKDKTQIIDFEKLIAKLDQDLLHLERRHSYIINKDELVPRILRIKEDLQLASQDLPLKYAVMNPTAFATTVTPTDNDEQMSVVDSNEVGNTTRISRSIMEGQHGLNVKELAENLRIRIREDGSVDWDGALASGTIHSFSHLFQFLIEVIIHL